MVGERFRLGKWWFADSNVSYKTFSFEDKADTKCTDFEFARQCEHGIGLKSGNGKCRDEDYRQH